MSETLNKRPQTTEQQRTRRTLENEREGWRPSRRMLIAVGLAATTATAAAVFSFNHGPNAGAESESPQATTSTEEVVGQLPGDVEETGETSQEALLLETFPFVVDGQEYEGVQAFEEAFTVPATPAAEYPGVYNSEERDAAIQADVNTAIEHIFDRVNLLIGYEFTDAQREEYSDYRIDYDEQTYLGTDALRMQFVREAVSQVLVGETDLDGSAPSPDEFINQLAHLSVVADWEVQNDGTPYEIAVQAVAGTDEIGGTELAGGAIVASGTVQVEVVTDRTDGDGTIFDLTGTREIDVVSSTEPVTWRVFLVNVTNEDGTASWKLTSADTVSESGDSLLQ